MNIKFFERRFSALIVFSALFLAPAAASASLAEFFSATGKLSLSVDGAGSNNASHIIQVEKPNASATVRKAFVLAASAGFSGRVLNNGDVSINGTPINWDAQVPGPIGNSNHRADVTSIVKTTIDAAASGRISFTFTEVGTGGIDGEILVVVFDDPAQTGDTTVVLLFGGQAVGGDTFAITLGEPIDPASSSALADMGLGISFGFQPSGQRSIVNVNGQRLTSSAGGQDDEQDASAQNGGLITVGGLDDSNANPPDPNATDSTCGPPAAPRCDDELYSLLPLITAQDSSINVFTQNPSNDDNIFFAYFHLSGAAIVGEGIVLSPTNATNPVGTEHTVTAKVTDSRGQPVVGELVTFHVISGPNDGKSGTDTTDANGEATFTYSDDGGAGTDQIQALTESLTSNIVTKEWTGGEENAPPTADSQSVTTPEDTPKVIKLTGGDADGDTLTFSIVTGPAHGDLSALSPASVSKKAKTKHEKQKKQKQKQKGKIVPGTVASMLSPKAVAAAVPSTAANNVTYTPDPNYNGPDSFTFRVNDGKTNSALATVSITVTPVNDPLEILSALLVRHDYSTPGIAAFLEFLNEAGVSSANMTMLSIKAKNLPKGCDSDVSPSDEVTIASPSSPITEALPLDSVDETHSEGLLKAVEIGQAALNAAAAQGCNVTLQLTSFVFHLAGDSSHQFSGTACIDTDTDEITSPCDVAPVTASRRLGSSTASKKLAAPVVR